MKHVPNLLTAARLALTPYLFVLMWRREYGRLIAWFIVIALTDVLDGFIARHFHASSKLGAYLDPVADKVLLSGAFLVLALTGDMETWLAGIVLGRDALILLGAGALYLAKSRRSFPPSAWGKVSTFAQILFVCFLVGSLDGIPVGPVAAALKWAVVALTVVSGLDYARRAVRGKE
jgi:cardiolipin synthase